MSKNYFEYVIWYKLASILLLIGFIGSIGYLIFNTVWAAFLVTIVAVILFILGALFNEIHNEKELIYLLEDYGEIVDIPEAKTWEASYAWIGENNFTCCISITDKGIHILGTKNCSYLLPWDNVSAMQIMKIKKSPTARLFLKKDMQYSSKLVIPLNDELLRLCADKTVLTN